MRTVAHDSIVRCSFRVDTASSAAWTWVASNKVLSQLSLGVPFCCNELGKTNKFTLNGECYMFTFYAAIRQVSHFESGVLLMRLFNICSAP